MSLWICPFSHPVLVFRVEHTLNFMSAMRSWVRFSPTTAWSWLFAPALSQLSHFSCLSCVFCNLNAFYLFLKSCLVFLLPAIEETEPWCFHKPKCQQQVVKKTSSLEGMHSISLILRKHCLQDLVTDILGEKITNYYIKHIYEMILWTIKCWNVFLMCIFELRKYGTYTPSPFVLWTKTSHTHLLLLA